jgi:hypothetical protein
VAGRCGPENLHLKHSGGALQARTTAAHGGIALRPGGAAAPAPDGAEAAAADPESTHPGSREVTHKPPHPLPSGPENSPPNPESTHMTTRKLLMYINNSAAKSIEGVERI